MKAIFDLVAPAVRLDCAEAADDAGCDAAPPWRTMRTATPAEARSAATAQYLRRRRRVSRLADQRPDEGFDLCAIQ
jgi:hypothetical protein